MNIIKGLITQRSRVQIPPPLPPPPLPSKCRPGRRTSVRGLFHFSMRVDLCTGSADFRRRPGHSACLCRVPLNLGPVPTARFGEESGNLLRSDRNGVILGAVIGAGFGELLAAAQCGDEEAFTQLWLDANAALLRYLRAMAPTAADDIAADTWVHVVRGLARFRGDEAAWRAWLFTTARRRMVDQGRRRSRRAEEPLQDVPAAALPVARDAADIALEHLSTRAAIALLADLPPLQAEVILLRVVAGLDTEAVAKLVRRSPGAVRVAAHRGLRRLAENLAEAGVTL